MKIGIIGPSETEIGRLIEQIELRSVKIKGNIHFYEGELNGIKIVSVVSGICKVNAAVITSMLISDFEVTNIMILGVAGGISSDLKVNDIVVSTRVAYHDVEPRFLIEEPPFMKSKYFIADKEMVNNIKKILGESIYRPDTFYGKIVTGESFIKEEGRLDIIEKFNPLCVDMETAAVSHVCFIFNIPFVAIRTISDTTGVDFHENFIKTANKSIDVVMHILNNYNLD